jgi:hypothetical protein
MISSQWYYWGLIDRDKGGWLQTTEQRYVTSRTSFLPRLSLGYNTAVVFTATSAGAVTYFLYHVSQKATAFY